MNSQKSFVPIIITIILIAVLGLGGTWFLYTEKQSLMAERSNLQSKLSERDANIDKLKNERARSEQELAVFKATDIVKEVELLRLKLKNIEADLAVVGGKITTLEATMTKIRLYADAIAAIDENLAPPPPTSLYSNLKNIDVKIGELNDSQVADQWGRAKSAFDAGGDGTADLVQALFLVTSKIRDLMP
ncbi:MAG: hypothetical protein HYT11_03605 [Candidatus Levybacteria bacterium]|nr:hypothetical protein [Candidatus Levybacteria bacterium]